MSKINKVLYNVDQRDSSKGTVNTREEMWMARNNIGLDEVIGHATVTENDKEYKGIAPLGTNGLVPAEYLPSFVNAVVNGYYYNGKFYREVGHTTEISPDENTTYVDITVADVGVGYRWTQASGYFQISSQNAFGALKAGNDTIHADQPMGLLTIVGDSGITVAVADTRDQEQNGCDKLTIKHSNSIVAGRIGEESPTTQINNTFNLPWASFDAQGHITATGSNAITIKNATTGQYGVTKLTSTPGTDETLAMTPKGVQTAIAALDANVGSTGGTNVALTVTEAGGVITGVSITKDDTAKAAHAHGNITSDGKVTTAAASKKAMLITNSSDQVVTGPAFGTASGDDNLFLNKNGNWSGIPAQATVLQWQQTTQGGESTYNADLLSIHQDFYTVTMHTTGGSDVQLGYLAPAMPSTQSQDMVLTIGAGSDVPGWSPLPQVESGILKRNNAELYFHHSGDGDVYHVRNVKNNAMNHVVVLSHSGDICSLTIEAPALGTDEEQNYYVVFDCYASSGSCVVDVENASPRLLTNIELNTSSTYLKTNLANSASDAVTPEAIVKDSSGDNKHLRIDSACYYGGVTENTTLAGPLVLTGATIANSTMTNTSVGFSGSPTYMIHVIGGMWELYSF